MVAVVEIEASAVFCLCRFVRICLQIDCNSKCFFSIDHDIFYRFQNLMLLSIRGGQTAARDKLLCGPRQTFVQLATNFCAARDKLLCGPRKPQANNIKKN